MIYLIALLSFLCSTIANAALLNIVPETVEAEAWTILDPQSGQVIAEHNSHVQRAPASLTKMMVAYIALKEIKAADPNATCVMCSAMGQQSMVIDAIQSGAKDFIVKPFQADRVIESIRKVLG